MKLHQLIAFFPPDRHADIDALYRRFQRDSPGVDVTAFVAELHAKGLLSAHTLRDLLTLGEVSLSEPPDRDAVLPHLTPRHQLVGKLGQGAMGEIFIGRDPDLLRTVAVKRIDPKLSDKPGPARRFFTEAQITAQLDHPSIVPIYNIERDAQGHLAYAMKLVRGETLADLIEAAKASWDGAAKPQDGQTLRDRLELFLPICNAIAYAHRRGILHRDLKPENIMVGSFGQVLVMDWGIARPIGDRERVTHGDLADKTRVGAVVGTPAYMSPEQAQGLTEGLDPRSDLYALGLILFELISLRPAVTGDSSFETVVRAASGGLNPLIHYAPKQKIPRELRGIVARATATDPDDRYESVDGLGEDLRRFLRDDEVVAAPDSTLQRVQRWISHHRALALSVGVGLVMTIFVAVALIMWRSAVVMEAQRQAARAREVAIAQVTALVNRQSHGMDTRFHRYESLLTGLAYVTENVLTRPAPEAKQYWPEDFADPRRQPPDLVASSVYKGDKISLKWPDFVNKDVSARPGLKEHVNRLSALSPTLKRVFLRSYSEDAMGLDEGEANALILEKGVPFIWSYAATREGVLVGYPGLGVYPDNYDPRERDWYTDALKQRGPVWGAAEADESGMGLLMTCSTGLYDDDDRFLGVAAVDIAFAFFIDELLESDALSNAGEALLIDSAGKVVVRGSQKDSALHFETYEQPLYENAQVLDAIQGGREAGHLDFEEDGKRQLAVFSRLEATGWVYLVVGEEEALLAAASAAGGQP